MKIKTKYYFAEKGVYQGSEEQMILEDRQIISLGNHAENGEQKRPFYYDDTEYAITYELSDKKQTIVINKLITEANYTINQREYLAKLTWLQRQKLLWMFKRHWLQQPGNVLHLFIVGLMLTIAYIGFEVLNGRF